MCACLHCTGQCGAGLQTELKWVGCKGARGAHSCPRSPVHGISRTGVHTAVPDTQEHGVQPPCASIHCFMAPCANPALSDHRDPV